MNTVEMNWSRTIKIWWFWFWRSLLVMIVIGAIVGVLIGALLGAMKVEEEIIEMIGSLLGIPISAAVSLVIFKSIADKQFSDFRVVLVAHDSIERSFASPNSANANDGIISNSRSDVRGTDHEP